MAQIFMKWNSSKENTWNNLKPLLIYLEKYYKAFSPPVSGRASLLRVCKQVLHTTILATFMHNFVFLCMCTHTHTLRSDISEVV